MKYGDAYTFGDTDHERLSIEPLCEDKLNPTLIHTSTQTLISFTFQEF